MRVEVAPEVAELLSDEQIEHVRSQAASAEAAICVRCGELIEAAEEQANLVLVADPASRRAAARLSHTECGSSSVERGEIPEPGEARLARRWATFVLPNVPLLVLEPEGGVWTDETLPAVIRMLQGFGFSDAADAFDSDLFASGEKPAPSAKGLGLVREGADLHLRIDSGETIETLPGAAVETWGELIATRGGALVAVSDAAELPEDETPVAFEDLLPRLLGRGLAAFVPLAAGDSVA